MQEIKLPQLTISDIIAAIADYRVKNNETGKIRVLLHASQEPTLAELKRIYDSSLMEFGLYISPKVESVVIIDKVRNLVK